MFSVDNRRLIAYSSAGVEEVPVKIVSGEDPEISELLKGRFDPIGGQGNYIVVAPSAQRPFVQQTLYDYNLIKGVQLGR